MTVLKTTETRCKNARQEKLYNTGGGGEGRRRRRRRKKKKKKKKEKSAIWLFSDNKARDAFSYLGVPLGRKKSNLGPAILLFFM